MSSSSDEPSIITIMSSDPLFSTLLSFFVLVLLNFPRLLWSLLFSPVFLLSGFLLLSLLRLGATDQDRNNQSQIVSETNETQELITDDDAAVVRPEEDCDGNDAVSEEGLKGVVSCACLEENSFVHWNVRAPLEVIYEEYEGEDHDHDFSNEPDEQVRMGSEIRYPSLSLYYPETDSDSSSDNGDDEFPMAGAWDSVDDNVCFIWDVEEDRDELIEISLDKTSSKASEFQLEEENLIEIDISPT